MKVTLAPDIARWIEFEIADGTFRTAKEAVNQAVRELAINRLRASLDAAEAEGGSYSGDDVLRYVRGHLAKSRSSP